MLLCAKVGGGGSPERVLILSFKETSKLQTMYYWQSGFVFQVIYNPWESQLICYGKLHTLTGLCQEYFSFLHNNFRKNFILTTTCGKF